MIVEGKGRGGVVVVTGYGPMNVGVGEDDEGGRSTI